MKRARLLIVTAVVAIAAPACASRGGSAQRVPLARHTASENADVPSAAGNRAAAQAEAVRLLSGAALVPGAVRTTSHPAGLSGPALGTSNSSQSVDRVAWFRVAEPLAQSGAWFAAHPQPGLVDGGTSEVGGPSGQTGYGFAYDPPTTPTWGSATLQIGLVALGRSATAIRVDGLAQWLDPTPERDTARGRTIRVTVSGGCPVSDRGVGDISNPGATDLDRHLLPSTAPTAAVECSYDGTNGSPFRLTRQRRLTAGQAGTQARGVRALPVGRRGSGPVNCPMDDGRAVVLAFAYPGRPDVDIWQTTSGCGFTDNGHITSSSF